MKCTTFLSFVLASTLGLGCSNTPPDGDDPAVDAANSAPNDAVAEIRWIPTWSLEDIQPMSPRYGQMYGLDAFAGKTLVVVLVQGF